MEPFSVKIAYDTEHPDFITLRIQGEVRIGTLEPIEKHLETIYPVCKDKKVLFDLTRTAFVSSTGWSLFLTAYQRIQSQGGRFLLTGMNTEVYYAFELLQFNEFMENYPDRRAAFREGLKEELYLPGKPPQEKIGYV